MSRSTETGPLATLLISFSASRPRAYGLGRAMPPTTSLFVGLRKTKSNYLLSTTREKPKEHKHNDDDEDDPKRIGPPQKAFRALQAFPHS